MKEHKLHAIQDMDSLYAAQEKIYAREAKGRFQTLRKIAAWILLGGFYLVAWLPWDDRQAILFDLPARQFHILGLTFWPQDFFFLAWLLVIAALALFFFTALAGRVWCGYACPQTVWTEVFVAMERWVEGGRRDQIRLSKMSWKKPERIRKVLAKQALWIAFALWTGFTFVGYFTPIRELGYNILITLSSSEYLLGPWETFWVLFYALATYGNAGFLREQVCLYMCPYARFQSVMFDSNSLIISYDEERGEPRMKGKERKQVGDKAGDCVDCNMCVQVCPTGIDIRDGLQYECITCAACIDICDDVMERHDKPKGLIRYTTENALNHKPSKIWRPRTVIYGILLFCLTLGLALSIGLRSSLDVEVLRDRNAFFRVVDEQHIANVYTLKILNKTESAQRYQIAVSGLEGASVEWVHGQQVAAGEMGTLPIRIVAPTKSLKGFSQTIELRISEIAPQSGGQSVQRETRFFGPEAAR